MAEVAGQATSYDLPNYLGELFQKSEKPNSILRLIGGLTGGVRLVNDTQFAMGVDYELPAAAQPNIVEGIAPVVSNTDTAQSSNVVQIFQEATELTYSLQGRSAQITGVAQIPGSPAGGAALNHPGSIDWQIARTVEKIGRHANLSFGWGVFVQPANNATARRTRGVRTAVVTNDEDHAAAALTAITFEASLQAMMDNGMFNIGDELFLIMDATQYARIAGFYEGTAGTARFTDTTERVGVQVRQILTKWAVLNLVWDPDATAIEIFVFRPEFCRVVAMPIPSKGVLFSEPMAKTVSAEQWQTYGEMGVDYRHEIYHGVIRNYT